ncbi:MAG: glycosyltransferase [Planctomycetota bacterium]
MDLSVVLPTVNEEKNVAELIPKLHRVCDELRISHQVLVADGGSTDATAARAVEAGAEVFRQQQPGYGGALVEAFQRVQGNHVLTMDCDLSHPPEVLRDLYSARAKADIIIASRYVKGGGATMPLSRKLLSMILNKIFRWTLGIPILDMSSGFRLYRRELLEKLTTTHRDFSFGQDILIQAYSAGYSAYEVPFHYLPRVEGSSKARVFKFGISYLKLLKASWKLRGSIRTNARLPESSG